ncbi:hypothetical protein T4B_12527 [Trichinella pseudospiralis]|uniref:Uncharacterized protein n=1 Tax=Trichinella pseudospiralis TaxID=6337 RepID=A0A0V1K7T4_TRIPS|nr:hypothetical protein T4B_12527 [Trichinella pseudospiralis]KRZ43280.1 hypothetical protein T4C_7717 [Trichinella pseudospiralis]
MYCSGRHACEYADVGFAHSESIGLRIVTHSVCDERLSAGGYSLDPGQSYPTVAPADGLVDCLLTFGGPLIPLEYRRKPHMLFGMHHRRCGVLSFVPASRVVPSSCANVLLPLVAMVCLSPPLLSTEIETTPISGL